MSSQHENLLTEEKDVNLLRKAISTAESDKIARRNIAERRIVQSNLLSERKGNLALDLRYRKTNYRCQSKLQRSPFRVDLVAENERIDEQNKVRLKNIKSITKGLKMK